MHFRRFSHFASIVLYGSFLVSLLFWNGCFFATQSYNTGRLLHPGTTQFGMGFSPVEVVERDYSREENYYQQTARDTTLYRLKSMLAYGMHYRLGILSKYPLGKGLEIGWLAQVPAPLYREFAATLECDARMGLKTVPLRYALYQHNVSVGWSIGQWVDNSWYAEYAGGLEKGWALLYGNYRLIYSGTDFLGKGQSPFQHTEDEEGNWKELLRKSKRSWNNRITFGLSLYTGKIPLLPDYILPEVLMLFPQYNKMNKFGLLWNVGVRWEFQ